MFALRIENDKFIHDHYINRGRMSFQCLHTVLYGDTKCFLCKGLVMFYEIIWLKPRFIYSFVTVILRQCNCNNWKRKKIGNPKVISNKTSKDQLRRSSAFELCLGFLCEIVQPISYIAGLKVTIKLSRWSLEVNNDPELNIVSNNPMAFCYHWHMKFLKECSL